MSQIDDNDQAAKEAAELLENVGPCRPLHRTDPRHGIDLPTSLICGQCAIAAVAERLRQRDAKIAELTYELSLQDMAASAARTQYKQEEARNDNLRERIAALESEVAKYKHSGVCHFSCDCVLTAKERIATLEAELAEAKSRLIPDEERRKLEGDILTLEAENEMLLKHVDDAQNEAGAMIRENERLATALRSIEREGHTWSKYWIVKEARAALAGRGK